MSYDIYIGNAEIEVIHGWKEDEPDYYDVHVPSITGLDAPSFSGDELTKNENHRHPGYSQWSGFCDEVGLSTLFFDKEDGLMRSHPGNAALRQEHAQAIEKALVKWQKKHPNAIPGWSEEEEVIQRDGNLARLIWLEWWVKYALANCERPCIENH